MTASLPRIMMMKRIATLETLRKERSRRNLHSPSKTRLPAPRSSSPGLVPAKKDRSRRIVIATAIGDEKPTGGKPTGGRARAKRRRKAERGSPASSELNSAI